MKILVVDIETTGFLNQGGKIVEVGVVEVDLQTGSKQILFDEVINPTELEDHEISDSWIVRNRFMTLEEIRAAESFEYHRQRLEEVIESNKNGATAYNKNFDFSFLRQYGLNLLNTLPCLMEAADKVLQIPPTDKMIYAGYGDKTKVPKAQEAYDYFFPNSGYIEQHRGADDALREADIAIALYNQSDFLK